MPTRVPRCERMRTSVIVVTLTEGDHHPETSILSIHNIAPFPIASIVVLRTAILHWKRQPRSCRIYHEQMCPRGSGSDTHLAPACRVCRMPTRTLIRKRAAELPMPPCLVCFTNQVAFNPQPFVISSLSERPGGDGPLLEDSLSDRESWRSY